jgi:SNF2 family DNA or RNA helicase
MPYCQSSDNPTLGSLLTGYGCDEDACSLFEEVVLPFRLMPHQQLGLHYGLYYNRFGLFFEPRTGKTIVMQLLAIFYARYGIGTVQIMPPGLFRQFLGDYEKIQGHGLHIHVLDDPPAKREKLFSKWTERPDTRPDVILLSQAIYRAHWQELYLHKFRNLHFDECHQGLMDDSNKISKSIRSFVMQNKDNRLVLSTGTPIPSRVENVYGIVRLINPEAYFSKTSFENAHVVKKQIFVPDSARGGYAQRPILVVSHYQRLDLLNENLYARAIYASKREVLDLGAPNIQIVPFELHVAHRTLYARLLRERVLFLEEQDAVLDARAAQKLRQTALQLISCPEAYDPKIGPKKNGLYETLHDLLGSLDVERNKVVVFANYTQSVEGIARTFQDLDPVTVYGPNGARRNAENVEYFRQSERCRLMVANPVSGGVGFKLGDVCTTVIFAEPVSSPGQFDQALSRVMLKGQTEPVLCYILKAEGTLAPLAIESMIGRVKDINAVLRVSKSIFSRLLGEEPLEENERELGGEEEDKGDC